MVLKTEAGLTLNYSLISQLFPDTTYELSLHAPRYFKTISLRAAKDCDPSLNPWDPYWKYFPSADVQHHDNISPNETISCFFGPRNCISEGCPMADPLEGDLVLVDFPREERMQLGRAWINERIPPPSAGRVHVSEGVAGSLKVSAEDILYLQINASAFISKLWTDFFPSALQLENKKIYTDYVYVPVTIDRILPSYLGKLSMYSTKSLYMDYHSFLSTATLHIHPLLPRDAQKKLKETDLKEYAQQILWNLPDRVENYIDTDITAIQQRVISFFSRVLYKSGFLNKDFDSSLPVLESLMQTSYFALFLGLILNIVIFILLFLAILLISSLLTIHVESKTFEMGVLRCLGINSVRLIYVLTLKAFSYSLPAWIFALMFSQLVYLVLALLFSSFTHVPVSLWLEKRSVWVATGLVIIVPLISSILPIWKILQRSILEALDHRRSKVKVIEVSIERSEGGRTYAPEVPLAGFLIALFGVSIYYVFPFSLLTGRLSLLMYILVFLLIGMLLGLVLLSSNLQGVLETFSVGILFWWDSPTVRSLLRKNLITHRRQNRSTAVMYSLSLAFIIFLAMSYSIQLENFYYGQEQGSGAYLRVGRSGKNPETSKMYGITIVTQLEEVLINDPNVESFSWVSLPLSEVIKEEVDTTVTNIGRIATTPLDVQAVSPNFFDVSFDKYYLPHSPIEGNALLAELYTPRGSSSVILPTAVKSSLALRSLSHVLVDIFSPLAASHRLHRLRALAYLDSMPFLYMSKYPSPLGDDKMSSLVSFPSFLRMTNGSLDSIADIPMETVLIKLKPGIPESSLDQIITKLSLVITSTQQRHLYVWDYRSAIVRAKMGGEIVFYFFSFAISVAMFISFFSLLSSMYSNIWEQKKEIAVMRVLGVKIPWIYRMYIYEAFLLVFTSSLTGTIIGYVCAFVLSLQVTIWNQFPVPLTFPWQFLLIISFFSILFSFLASWRPIQTMLSLQPVELLRSL